MDPGALSYRHPSSGEWAHDHRDPLGEAQMAFVGPALQANPPRQGLTHRLLEVGFGRGLNTATALRSLVQSDWHGQIEAFGMEPYPESLHPWPELPAQFQGLAPWWGQSTGDWELPEFACTVRVRQQKAEIALAELTEAIDWIFLDLFSPSRHKQAWPDGLYRQLAEVAAAGAALTSYCCARVVRDGLENAGWRVKVLRRPGYRDTLLARWFA
jgi:tRNA 5-methylaminomethyl-2-thiouridine biosynthesis bifunctional protein